MPLVLELGLDLNKIPFIPVIPVIIVSVPLLCGQLTGHLDALMLFLEHNPLRGLSGDGTLGGYRLTERMYSRLFSL
jgi:hypothetical protein